MKKIYTAISILLVAAFGLAACTTNTGDNATQVPNTTVTVNSLLPTSTNPAGFPTATVGFATTPTLETTQSGTTPTAATTQSGTTPTAASTSSGVTLETPTVMTTTPLALQTETVTPTPTETPVNPPTPTPKQIEVQATQTAMAQTPQAGVTGTPSAATTGTATPQANIPQTGSNSGISAFKGVNPTLEYAGLGVLNRRANPTSKISAQYASQLKSGWNIATDDMVTGMPLVDNGSVYFADWSGTIYAANASNGSIIWKKKVEQPNMQWPWYGFAGTGALGNGAVYFASVEGNAFALDMKTGNVLWQVKFTNNQYAGNLGKLMYYDGMVYLGTASVEEPMSHKNPNLKIDFQGEVMALDAKTGKQVWDLPLVQSPGNGVAEWGSFALDPNTNTLYFGTGNNYTGEATKNSDSVFSVNAKTGKVNWSTQVTSEDIWLPIKAIGGDYDFGAGPQLFNATINGQNRQLMGIGQKSGFYWVFDRTTGEPIWKTFVGAANVGGGIRGEAAVKDGVIYVWSNNAYQDGKDPSQFLITVKALDAATGKNLWVTDQAQPAVGWSAGFLAGDVFFVGSLDGTIQGYNIKDGSVVFKATAPGPVGSPLLVANNTLFVGAGVPKGMGGQGSQTGLFTWTTGQ